jgi:hypothetical protein
MQPTLLDMLQNSSSVFFAFVFPATQKMYILTQKDPTLVCIRTCIEIARAEDFSHSCELLFCESTYVCLSKNNILEKIFQLLSFQQRIEV